MFGTLFWWCLATIVFTINMSDSESPSGSHQDLEDDTEGTFFGEGNVDSSVEGDLDLGEEDGSDEDMGGWPDRDTAKLIDLYCGHPELYVVTHKWYAHKERKTGTYLQMATEMGCSGMYVFLPNW
jgi:hypothetical protein